MVVIRGVSSSGLNIRIVESPCGWPAPRWLLGWPRVGCPGMAGLSETLMDPLDTIHHYVLKYVIFIVKIGKLFSQFCFFALWLSPSQSVIRPGDGWLYILIGLLFSLIRCHFCIFYDSRHSAGLASPEPSFTGSDKMPHFFSASSFQYKFRIFQKG
jgi:hypothetical protein